MGDYHDSEMLGVRVLDSDCHHCARRNWVWVSTCEAFSEGIPIAILAGDLGHRVPIEGDHGLQYLASPLQVP